MKNSIVHLPELVEGLPVAERALFHRLFHLSITVGEVVPPKTMHAWIERHFGSLEAVRRQRIIKLTNRITLEGTLFNELRASRPIEIRSSRGLEETLAGSEGGPFCRPRELTPADVFGRIEGNHSITASNVAKYDGFHGLVIFQEHHPLHFDRQAIVDYLRTGYRWAKAAHQRDPEAIYYFFMWNCLWKSGASILHGHAQMTVSRGMHYARVEALRQATLRYRSIYGTTEGNYFTDLARVHRALGLARSFGSAEVLAYLTPIKEKEMLLVGRELSGDFADALYALLKAYVQHLGVRSFNLALFLPPLVPVEEDWTGFPGVVARVVDRGDPESRTSDIGAMELYASSVVASDPFRVMEVIR